MVKNKLGAAAAAAPKGDPTGKYTLNGWGQTEADFAYFDLAQDNVELKSDGWRWIVDPHRGDDKRYIVEPDDLLSAFLESEATLP